jgi:RNA polymerase sigma-70 factor (ECF subfamily)
VQRLGDPALAEEAVQDVFVRAWRAAHRFDPAVASLRTWLFAICRNVVVDVARSRASRPAVVAEGEQAERIEPMSADPRDRVLLRAQLEEALGRLSAPHREVVLGAVVHDRPYSELAARAGVPESTVRTRLFYGLRALRLALEEQGWIP